NRPVSPFFALLSFGSEFSVPVCGGDSAVYEEIAADDDSAVGGHEKRANGCPLVWSAGPPSHGCLDHSPISRASGSSEFVPGQRGHNDARADRVYPRSTFAPANCLSHDTQ